MEKTYNLQRLRTRTELAAFLGLDVAKFESVIAFVPTLPAEQRHIEDAADILDFPEFLRHDIPKRNPARGNRTVWEPIHTMATYKALGRRLDLFFHSHLAGFPHPLAFGYRPRKNILENAWVHRGKRRLLSVDIRDFFPSIGAETIRSLFEDLGVHPEVSEDLASFLTVGRSLALGLPTSPVVSNAVALPLDCDLEELATAVGAAYSRYADDITFSSNEQLPDLADVQLRLSQRGFALAGEKTRYSRNGQAHYVTGLSVSDSVRPHVPKETKHRLRQELYYAKKYGLEDHLARIGDSGWIQAAINRLDGMVRYVSYHEPTQAPQLRSTWQEILATNRAGPSFQPKNQHRPPFTFFIDETEMKRNGKNILALCMVATQRPDSVMDATDAVRRRLVSDLWTDGDPEKLESGLHFNDMTEDHRLEYAKTLALQPIAGYVGLIEYAEGEYEQTYLRILRKMLPRRLMAAESKFTTLYVEQNSKVSRRSVRELVDQIYAQLAAVNNRRPQQVSVDFVAKPHSGVSAADFMLGVFSKYVQSRPPLRADRTPRELLMFDRLRDKFRVISDYSDGVEYTRRSPITPWNKP